MARINAMPEPERVSSITRNGKEATIFRTVNEDGEERFSVSGDNAEPIGSYTNIETAKRMAEKHVGPRELSRQQKKMLSDETQRQMRGLQIPITQMNALSEAVENNFRTNEMDSETSVREAIQEFKDRGIITDPNARTATQAQSAASEAVARARETISSPENAELRQQDPAMDQTEREIAKMVEMQARGENPYVKRAKDFYERIKNDITATRASPERKETVKNFLAAIERAGLS